MMRIIPIDRYGLAQAILDSESHILHHDRLLADCNYGVSAYKGDLHLFDGEFTTKDGILVFSFEYEIRILLQKTEETGGFFSNILKTDEKKR